jgi:predicted AlkP superfamily pyrophosphatase or phosphodiesterase
MKKGSLLWAILSLACVAFLRSTQAEASTNANTRVSHILFLTADGFRTDYIEWYNPPHLKELLSEGVRVLHVTNVFPTVTAPNMCSLVTGAYPRTTSIAANAQYVKELDQIVEKPRDNKAKTIAEMLHEAGWKTAAVNHFMLENRGTDFYVSAGYDESEKTTDAVLDLLNNKDARFVGAIYGATDHAGHQHGPRSDEVTAAVLSIDAAVGRLVDGLKRMGLYDKTLIAFTADHGMSVYEPKTASIEPAKALREAGFTVATTQKDLKKETQIIVISAGVRVIYFRKLLTAEEKEKVLQTLSNIEGVEVLDRKRLDPLGCHDNRSGDLIVSPLPGYTISRSPLGGGQHGRFAERNPILLFCGPGFKKGATVEGAQTIDVVPTLLKVVNVPSASTVDGHVIADVFEK